MKHEKMSVENRAKQFMPFAALPGLNEALARVEQSMESSGATGYAGDSYPLPADVSDESRDLCEPDPGCRYSDT